MYAMAYVSVLYVSMLNLVFFIMSVPSQIATPSQNLAFWSVSSSPADIESRWMALNHSLLHFWWLLSGVFCHIHVHGGRMLRLVPRNVFAVSDRPLQKSRLLVRIIMTCRHWQQMDGSKPFFIAFLMIAKSAIFADPCAWWPYVAFGVSGGKGKLSV